MACLVILPAANSLGVVEDGYASYLDENSPSTTY